MFKLAETITLNGIWPFQPFFGGARYHILHQLQNWSMTPHLGPQRGGTVVNYPMVFKNRGNRLLTYTWVPGSINPRCSWLLWVSQTKPLRGLVGGPLQPYRLLGGGAQPPPLAQGVLPPVGGDQGGVVWGPREGSVVWTLYGLRRYWDLSSRLSMIVWACLKTFWQILKFIDFCTSPYHQVGLPLWIDVKLPKCLWNFTKIPQV